MKHFLISLVLQKKNKKNTTFKIWAGIVFPGVLLQSSTVQDETLWFQGMTDH